MAHYGDQLAFTMVASGDLSAKQYHVMRAIGAGTTSQGSLSSDAAIIGVLQNDPKNGDHATIAYSGLSKLVAGAAITANDLLTLNSSGRAITQTGSQQIIIGRAISAAAADGNTITALLNFPTFRA